MLNRIFAVTDMHKYVYLLFAFAAAASARGNNCKNVKTINVSLRDIFCLNPVFTTMLPKTEENELLDNICFTSFPLPDDPSTFKTYISRVYCDGSHEVRSIIITEMSSGVFRQGDPYVTLTDRVIGYAGCDTYLIYSCKEYGVEDIQPFVFGVSPKCNSVGLSCLRKVEELIREQCLPDDEYYILPMKLPNRCVTQQVCTLPSNPFYNQLSYYKGGYAY